MYFPKGQHMRAECIHIRVSVLGWFRRVATTLKQGWIQFCRHSGGPGPGWGGL